MVNPQVAVSSDNELPLRRPPHLDSSARWDAPLIKVHGRGIES